jgi:signal transduction histidine kinase
MNEAARSQAESARQSVTEAYRAQLRLLRDRIDSYWKSRAAAIAEDSGAGTAPEFTRIVFSGLCDSLVLLDNNGVVTYPVTVPPVPAPDPRVQNPDWRAARALEAGRPLEADSAWGRIADSETDPSAAARAAQAQIRCLVRSGRAETAIRMIQQRFATGTAARGLDLQRRLIAADEQLLALRLMKPSDTRYLPAIRRLAALLNDYRDAPIPSAQRLFLMDELRAAAPGQAVLPTNDAESLAAQFLEGEPPRAAGPTLQPARVPGLWKLAVGNGRAIALYRTETVFRAISGLLNDGTAKSVKFVAIQPGRPSAEEAIAAGPMLPGWQLSFSLLDARVFDEAARRRTAAYLWVGFLAVAAMAVAGLIVAQAFRRQWRLARLKTDLLAAVSHELKTPLASMRLLVDALLEENKFEPEKTRDYLELIAGENRRLSRLIGNFLTFSRIERNRQKFEFTETRPEDVVRAAVHAMRERLQAPACHLEIDVADGLPVLRADQDALVTVLLNLLDNAHKYTPTDRRILLQAYREGNNVVFAVKDNGIGIAPREQKRIFRRFYQVDRRLARETGGCGLGLSIVDFIVRAHGGAVRVESKPGAGSTFRVLTPFGVEPKAASA